MCMQKVKLHTRTHAHTKGESYPMWMWPNDPAVTHSAHLPQRGTEGGDRGGGEGVVREGEVRSWGRRMGGGHKSNLGRNRAKKECVFMVNFEFSFAQMCCLVLWEVLVVLDPPLFLLCALPLLTNTTHTLTHTHALKELNVFLLAWGSSIYQNLLSAVSFKLEPSLTSYGK